MLAQIESSYRRQSGTAIIIWLIGSGGVRNIARMKAMTIAKRRFSRREALVTSPNQPSTKITSGIWKTRPKAITVLRTIEM